MVCRAYPTATKSPVLSPSKSKILVVDDSAIVRHTVAEIIRKMGHTVIEAEDGTAVLPLVAEHHPALIILDIHMPEKSGFQALEELRASEGDGSDTPVIILTASAEPRYVRQALGMVISGYLVKSSLVAAEIRERVNQTLQKPVRTKTAARHVRAANLEFHVLLADDSSQDRQLLSGLLSKWGCLTTAVENGKEVLSVLAEDGSVDVLIINDTMPEMDGYEATQTLREKESSGSGRLPVILISSQPLESVRERCLSAGMDAYIGKPVNPDKLYRTLGDIHTLRLVEETPARSSDAVYDWEELMERVDDDIELLQRMLYLFGRDYPQLLVEIRTAVESANLESLKEAAHTLRGMLANLTAHLAADIAAELENVEESRDLAEYAEMPARLETEVERANEQLSSELSRVTKP